MNRDRIFWGIVLLVGGALLLMNNLGWLGSLNIWKIAWPAFLILLGIWVLVRPYLGAPALEKVAVSLDSASRGKVRLEYGAGMLEVSGGAAAGMLLEGECGGGAEIHSGRSGDVLDVRMESTPSGMFALDQRERRWKLHLAQDIPLELDIRAGAASNDLNLSNLLVNVLHLSCGASSTTLTLPANAGLTLAEVEAGAASTSVRIPQGVAARIRFQGGLSSFGVDSARFPKQGDVHISPDFDSAANKVDLKIEAGVGSVDVA